MAGMHAAIAQGFLELARTNAPYPGGVVPKRVVINAQGTPGEVFVRVLQAVDGLSS